MENDVPVPWCCTESDMLIEIALRKDDDKRRPTEPFGANYLTLAFNFRCANFPISRMGWSKVPSSAIHGIEEPGAPSPGRRSHHRDRCRPRGGRRNTSR